MSSPALFHPTCTRLAHLCTESLTCICYCTAYLRILVFFLQDYVGELLFSINTDRSKDAIRLLISKAKDLHIEDEISVLGMTPNYVESSSHYTIEQIILCINNNFYNLSL